ncbi:MAG: porin family protein [Patiriisocius sp.]|uniref:porin family protein n=1 Tax=Patiriisocius sp. TaxID=2822396 RepID=UPI003EFA7943
MKKLFLLTTILIVNISYSQSDISFGINGGATFSSIRGNEAADESKSSLDVLIGIAVVYPTSDKLSIKTNLNYERKSVNVESFSVENVTIRSTYSYVSLPVMVKYNFSDSNSFYINGGPFVAFLINANSKADEGPDFEFTDLNKNIDAGISFGIGKRIELSNNYLDIEIRNNLGLVNISAVEVINDDTIKTNSLNLILTYYLSL